MLKQKKVTWFILAFITTICLSIGPFVSSVKANTYTYVYTSNGIKGNAAGARDIEANYYVYNTTSKYYRTVIDVSWECNITGTFTLSLANSSSTADTILCDGCVINSYVSTTLIQFKCTDVNHCKIEFYTLSDQRGVADFYGNWHQSSDIDTINTTLGQIKGYVDDVETSLNNIYTRLGTINTTISLGNTILGEIKDLLSSELDGLRIRFNFNTTGYTYQQYEYVDYTNHFYQVTLDNLNVARIGIAFNEVIRNGNYLFLQLYLRSSGTIPNDFADNLVFGCRDISSNVRTISNIYKVISRFGSNTLFLSIYVPLDSIYMFGNTNEYLYDFDIQGINILSMSLFGFTSIGVVNNLPYDDEYISLLQEINQGISALQSDQTTIDQSTNITNNFNTEINKINVIENNILTGFDNKINTVNSAINDSGVLDPQVTQTPKAWAEYYSGLVFDNLTVIKYPVYIILIGFVLLCLLG